MEDTSEFCQVIDIAPSTDQSQDVPRPDSLTLRVIQAELSAVGILVSQKLLTVGRAVKGVAHLVQRIALHGSFTIENIGARNRVPWKLGVAHMLYESFFQ